MPKWIVNVRFFGGRWEQYVFNRTDQAVACFEMYSQMTGVVYVRIYSVAEVTT